MTGPEFMRRDQVPKGREWQTFDDDDWCAYDSTIGSGFEARWVRVRPVAATPPDRWTTDEEGWLCDGGVRVVQFGKGSQQHVLTTLNSAVLRPADPTGPPADTCQTCDGTRRVFASEDIDAAIVDCPDCVGSPVPAYKDEPEWLTVLGTERVPAIGKVGDVGEWVGVTTVGEARLLDPARWKFADYIAGWRHMKWLKGTAPDTPVVVRRTEADR